MSIIKFDYMNEDNIMSNVTIENGNIIIVDMTDDVLMQFLGKRPHIAQYVNEALEYRCFDRRRPDRDHLLRLMGLHTYNPLDIVRVTHGAMTSDFFWIRFEGETLTWYDVDLRRLCNNLD